MVDVSGGVSRRLCASLCVCVCGNHCFLERLCEWGLLCADVIVLTPTRLSRQAEVLQRLQHGHCGETAHQHTTRSPGSDRVCASALKEKRCMWFVCTRGWGLWVQDGFENEII